MDGIRCPKCRTVNYAGLMGFPRCHNCHEQLRQCRYCTHQLGGLCQLQNGDRPRLQSAEGLPWCDAHSSRFALSEDARPLERPVGITPRTIAALSIACVLLVWMLLLAFGEEHGVRLEAREELVRVIDGRAVAQFEVRGETADLESLRLAVELQQAPGYAVEEVAAPPELAIEGNLPRSDLASPIHGDSSIEVHLMADHAAPPLTTLTVALLAADGDPLARASTTLRNRPVMP